MLKVNVVGIGPGNPELLTFAARKAIDEATVIIGDQRMTDEYAHGKTFFHTIKVNQIAEILEKADPVKDIAAILVSGDVGFFSLGNILCDRLSAYDVHNYPGISSVSYFAARLGIPWSDAKLMSMHGRNNDLVAGVRENAKLFTLTGGLNSAQYLCRLLADNALGSVRVTVGQHLSYPEEKIITGTARELAKVKFPSLAVMLIENSNPVNRKDAAFGISDDKFARVDKVPMTKAEIRAVIVSKMQLKHDAVVYDIGAGTGSCSVEFALSAYSGEVYAFEKNEEALKAIHLNIAKFGLRNVVVIAGDGEKTLQAAPAPDCVFIGGSGGKLHSMLDTVYKKNSCAGVVITVITLETLAEVTNYYKDKNDYVVDIVNVNVARAKKLGQHHLMLAQNPIYIISIENKEGAQC